MCHAAAAAQLLQTAFASMAAYGQSKAPQNLLGQCHNKIGSKIIVVGHV